MKSFGHILILAITFSWPARAEFSSPRVPANMVFADMKLKLTDDAREEIQREVDLLRQSEKYYNIKADRVKLYFPIIERILKEEGVPTDFKYLALQESSLISDAVSSANAVGFWQFKDFTGREVGLRIDKVMDERLNIQASTYGAAKYFTRHNFYFKNWIYSLLAHMTGMGGAKKHIDKSKYGASKMVIDKHTHWYIRRCLAHKIAFEDATDGKHTEGLSLAEFTKGAGMTLDQIAEKTKVDKTELFKYNKWLKSGPIPDDKEYLVLIPTYEKRTNLKKISKPSKPEKQPVKERDEKEAEDHLRTESKPVDLISVTEEPGTIYIRINGIPSILARAGDDFNSLSQKTGISSEQLARFNDLTVIDDVVEGEIYYLRPKRLRASTYYYRVKAGESLWEVSQRFGIKLKRLAKFNRMDEDETPVAGRMLWLHKKMSKYDPVEIEQMPSPTMDEEIASNVQSTHMPEVIPVVNAKEEAEVPVEMARIDEADLEEKVEEEVVAADLSVKDDLSRSFHTVVAGETLYAIARKYGMAVKDLIAMNGLESNSLNIGQQLLVVGEVDLAKTEIKPEVIQNEEVNVHEVVPGDTMYSISRQYGISVKDLLRINQKDNFALDVGEKLRVRE